MRRVLALVGVLAVVGAALAVPAFADEAGDSLTATVTPGTVSVTLSTTTVAYGTVALSTDDGTRSTATSGNITATNNGTVSEDFYIKGADATGTVTWTLQTDGSLSAVNEYIHQFNSTDLTLANQSLQAGVAASGGTNIFTTTMVMPITASDSSAHSTTVTVTAVEAGAPTP